MNRLGWLIARLVYGLLADVAAVTIVLYPVLHGAPAWVLCLSSVCAGYILGDQLYDWLHL